MTSYTSRARKSLLPRLLGEGDLGRIAMPKGHR